MKILFIGGTGNISADCASLFSAHGHEVSVVTRGRTPVPAHCSAFLADRKDLQAMRRALQGQQVEIVLNFLGYDLSDVQTDFTLFHGRIRQYVFISSATVYAKPAPRLPITEETPLGNPWWDYAQKKLACERWLLQRWHEDRFPVTIVRPSHTYSRRWIPNPVSSSSYTFAARMEQGRPLYIPDDGETPWTLTASTDFAIGLAGLLGNTGALGEALHITSDEVLSWNQIYAQIAEALGVPLPEIVKIPTDFICQVAPRFTGTLKGDKAHAGVFDNSKIKRFVPDFQCRKPFRVGVRASVEWLRAHPEHQNLNPQVDQEIEAVLLAWEREKCNREAV